MPFGRFVYEVDNERERHVVDLVRRTYSCRAWDLTGIPYKYGVAAIFVNREPYTMASSSSNQVARSQPQAPTPQPQAPWSQPPTPRS